jgi:hypothetical protein
MTALEWNSKIKNDGGDFKTLPEGIYPFTVKTLERAYNNGTKNIPPCPMAKLVLRVGVGTESSDVTNSLYLDDSQEWKLCQFFLAIGDRKHGEELQMDWDKVAGKSGWVELEHYTYEKDGEEKTINSVVRYIDPAEAPADGKPIVKSGVESTASDEW